jgi:adenylosuccinate synthase
MNLTAKGLLVPGKLNVVIDGQWGSSGKGKLFGWIYNRAEVDVVIGDNMPNAGHTYVADNGVHYMSKALPLGSWFPNVRNAAIGPYSAFTMVRFIVELQQAREARGDSLWKPVVDPMAVVVVEGDAAQERNELFNIASTMQGGAEAVSKKVKRSSSAILARDVPELAEFVGDTGKLVRSSLSLGGIVISETSQGFDLSLNKGHSWPHVTSRDCLVGRAFDNAGVSPRQGVGSVIGCIRTFPIRVGAVSRDGNSYDSGPYYEDQIETTWEALSASTGQKLLEMTTVTGRIRRVFTFSMIQLVRFMEHVRPSHLFVNFVNYLTDADSSLFDWKGTDALLEEIEAKAEAYGCKFVLMGVGEADKQMLWRE